MRRHSIHGARGKAPAIVVLCGGQMTDKYFNHHLPTPKVYEIVGVTLANDALRQVARRLVPLVICDDTAPSMRSFQLMSEIKNLSPDTQVVLIVPSGSPEQEQRARAAGADAYLPQAFALKRLRAIIAGLRL